MSIVQKSSRVGSTLGKGLKKGVRAFGKMKSKKARTRRGRGITARELRGFRKVTNLLRKVGMHPRGLGRASHRRK